MSRIIFISNRLPVTVQKNDEIEYHKSIGGLATGLKSYHEQSGSIWVGWPGLSSDDITKEERKKIRRELGDTYGCLPVFLSGQEIDEYYHGFCNKTIWPLFHYFQSKTEYNFTAWETYKDVNIKFFKTVEPIIGDEDTIWIHDYQLMLLPNLIKERFPNTRIGFFPHIPFPSFEIFRLLIWREEILRGLLGADLIGFHTYDYVRHFLSSVRRILNLESNLNSVNYEDRCIRIDAFPMGIDYDHFISEIETSPELVIDHTADMKTILSIDRLDYTKGVPERIRAFSKFLYDYPQYHEKVKLYLIVAPSREEVDSYDELRREITERVAEINGRYGTVNWMPLWFFYKSFTQEQLISFYRQSDVLLVTPLRDGMNLIVKEYIAARTDFLGMVVMSETAGAASELSEAVIVNANNYREVALGIKNALEMPDEQKILRNRVMNNRLKRYNVHFWASEFLNELNQTVSHSKLSIPERNIINDSAELEIDYKNAKKRILFLDYDGTLVPFAPTPDQAGPDAPLKNVLSDLAHDPKNTLVIISGRDRHTLEKWLGDLDAHLLAAHGLWLRPPRGKWSMTVNLENTWKESIRHVLELFADRMPGALIEEKEYSLAFHYRQCDPYMIEVKLGEVREALMSMTRSMNLGLLEGHKVLEIKDNRVSKGFGASLLIQNGYYDFIMGAGDDYTDEDLFSSLPEGAVSIKIGPGDTCANYRAKSVQAMRLLLKKLRELSKHAE